ALETNTEDVKAISESWNRDFDATSLPDNPSVYASFGPYNLTDFSEDGTMVFEAREDYTWGPQPGVQTLVYSIIGDPTAAVQAMANEEVDVIQPQVTADILTQLEGIADRGVEVRQGDGATYEHIDLAVANGGPFDPATYGGDEETARIVRQAFLLSVPRQEIVDRLILPLNENAVVRNSLTQVPGSPAYDDIVASNGSDFYAEADPEAAAQLLADAGVETPIDVRNMFADDNPRRASEYELIRDSVAQAGFNLIDGRDINWGSNLANPSLYDAVHFGWQTTAIAVADTGPNFVTDGQNNFYGYSNETVDALYDELNATTDPARQDEILAEVEAVLFEDAFGLPIFQFPEVTAYNSTYVDGVSSIAIAPTVFFNVWDWTAV
ncbi:MAG: ABC transporter substrate-binding protein, partial [Ilumatobacter sp.]